MKKEDFDRLKAVCEKEGFEIESSSLTNSVLVRKKKDIWEGVGFGRITNDYSESDYIAGKIYPVNGRDGNFIITLFDEYGDADNGLYKSITPSTKKEYVEQLKREAFELFGEIKIGDKFTSLRESGRINTIDNGDGFRYFGQTDDILTFNGCLIYEIGKWAEKVKDRVKVDPTNESINRLAKNLSLNQQNEVLVLFASQLEKYLNDEI